jgi:tetraacyldisaccharide 4'-kinase
MYTKIELEHLLEKHQATSLLITSKDDVKIKAFNLPSSLLMLQLNLSDALYTDIDNFVNKFYLSQ